MPRMYVYLTSRWHQVFNHLQRKTQLQHNKISLSHEEVKVVVSSSNWFPKGTNNILKMQFKKLNSYSMILLAKLCHQFWKHMTPKDTIWIKIL